MLRLDPQLCCEEAYSNIFEKLLIELITFNTMYWCALHLFFLKLKEKKNKSKRRYSVWDCGSNMN